MDRPSAKYEIIHSIVSQKDNLQNVKELCNIAGVSRSGYYNWLASEDKRLEREAKDKHDFELILNAYSFRGYDKGIRGIHMRLLHMDPPVLMNIKKIQRLMRKYGLSCPIRKANPYRRMAKALKTDAVSENLLNRQFKEHGPRKVKLYPIKWTHLFHNFLLFGHRFFIGIPINWTYFLFKTLFLRHTFACVSSIIGLHTEVIQMTNYHCPTRFTPEQMKVLSANPFTYKVSAIYIHYTLEFKNLFLAHYEAGEPVKDIFAAFGYDPAILGDNRMYAFARRISKQAKEGKVPTEDSSSVKIQKPAKVDYNTLPAQQSVSAMQREIAYLRQQIEFLKKITELDNDRKPRT